MFREAFAKRLIECTSARTFRKSKKGEKNEGELASDFESHCSLNNSESYVQLLLAVSTSISNQANTT